MITLERAKLHLRIVHDEEDGYLNSLIDATNAWMAQYLGSDLPKKNSANSGLVEAAQLLLIADLYENRELTLTSAQQKNPTFQLLLEPLREKAVR